MLYKMKMKMKMATKAKPKQAKNAKDTDPFKELVDYVDSLEEGAPPRQSGFDHGGE